MVKSAQKDRVETSLVRDAEQNWARHWDCEAEQIPRPTRGFRRVIKRFVCRSGGLELICRIVRNELPDPEGKLMLEAGCGKGEIALRVAEAGVIPVLLDTSLSALKYCKARGDSLGVASMVLQASILQLPFKEGVLDFAFNVGVLDHFGPEKRDEAVREMLRILKKGSRVVVITNDARSIVHPIAMKRAIERGIWPFGFKAALYSLKDSLRDVAKDFAVKEYSRGFVSQFEFLHYFLPAGRFFKGLFYRLFYVLSFPLNFLNRLPGQYLVTVIDKAEK